MPFNARRDRGHDAHPEGLISKRVRKKKNPVRMIRTGYYGAPSQIRTGDLILTMDALYLLSYRGGTRTAFEVYHRHFALTININKAVIDYLPVFYYNAQVLI